MNIIQFGSFLSCLVTCLSCQVKTDHEDSFTILPLPQEFKITGTSNLNCEDIQNYYLNKEIVLPKTGELLSTIVSIDQKSDAQIICNINTNSDIPPEGYHINISKNQISFSAADQAGLLYAFMSLQQLLEDAKEQNANLPLCTIKDYPLLSYRAIHLDMKHHLEKTGYYYHLIDKLASYKVNAIIAEMEDKLQYVRQSELGSSDALSISEWKKLCNYAIERNIEISPLIQGLGHSSFILKHEQYTDLRDNPDSDWAFDPLNPRTYDVQFDLYLDAIDATPHGKYLHIGGDEVHTTGRNSGKSALELQLIWLDKVCKFAEEHDRIPIFWDDMPLKHAGVYQAMFDTKLSKEEVDEIWKENEHKLVEFLDQFPKNCIYMRWNYSSSQAIGNGKAMDWFQKNNLQVMGATAGQTRWFLMPQNESNMENIESFATQSVASGLKGLLLTLWDDDSPHFELYNRGIIAFAEYTWSGAKRTKDEIKTAYRQREFSSYLSDQKYAFTDLLEHPVAFHKNALLKGNSRNRLIKSKNPSNLIIDLPDINNKGAWSKKYAKRLNMAASISLKCDSIADRISYMKSKAVRNLYTLEVYEQVNNLVKFSSDALLDLQDFDMANNENEEASAATRISEIPNSFRDLRNSFEQVYAKSRILTKPDDYILDQDHHQHLANQTKSFDWQFYAEICFLKKLSDSPLFSLNQ